MVIHHDLMLRFVSRQFVFAIMITITLAVLPSPVAATYPPGDPPETVPFGTQGGIEDYELTVVNVAVNPFGLLDAYNPGLFVNSSDIIVMIQIEATYTGDDKGYADNDFSFSITDGDNYHYDHNGNSCERWPLSPDAVQFAAGETRRFNLCFEVPVPPVGVSDLQLVAFTNLITDQWPVPFSLDEPDGTHEDDDAVPPCGCTPPTYNSERT